MNNFLLQDKGKTEFLPRRIVWSPDGSSVIVSSFSNDLQIIKISDFSNPFTIKNPTTVTDIVWYPLMDINNPSSCAYASVCPMCPIYLIDSNDGHIRSSYRCQCKGDRAASLTSLLFNGASILAGGTKALFQCDISRSEKLGTPILKCPGSILSVSSHKLSSIISLGLSTGDLIYIDSRTYECVLTSKFHNHGLDSQNWNNDFLITSARLENEVYCIDMRSPNIPCNHFQTCRKTSRYISLGSNEIYLIIGNEEKEAQIYDVNNNFQLIGEVGNGPTPLAVPSPKDGLICAGSGKFEIIEDDEEEDVYFEPILKQFGLYKMSQL